MANSSKPVPDGYHTVSPYLTVQGAAKLIDFLKQVFDAKEIFSMSRADGTLGHAAVSIGDSVVMLAEATDQWKPMPAALHMYVNDADTTYQKAIRAGATSVMEPADQFYGDRSGGVQDMFGNFWWISTHIEDVSNEEMEKRAAALGK